jgi:hypothetical protein
MKEPRTLNRILQLVLLDMNPNPPKPEVELAAEWGLNIRSIRNMRHTEEYQETLHELQGLTMTSVAQQLGEVQATALRRLEVLVPQLADAAEVLLQGSPTAPAVTAANAVVRTLAELGIVKLEVREKQTWGKSGTTPNLVLAESETSVIRSFRG